MAGVQAVNEYLDRLIERWRKEPDRVFAHYYGKARWIRVSIDELMQRAFQFSRSIEQANVGPGEVVFITLQYGFDAHAAFVGGMLAGVVPSFLPHPSAKQEETMYWHQHREVLAHIAPGAVIVEPELKDAFVAVLADADVAVIATSAIGEVGDINPARYPGTEAIALLQHSSGTTGLKKGTALSYKSICLQTVGYQEAIALGAVRNPVVGTWLPLYHDMGLITSFLMPLWLGVPIVGINPFDWVARPAVLFEAIESFLITHLWMPNFAFHHLVRTMPQDRKFNLESIRMIVNCSEPCKPAAFDSFLARFSDIGITAAALQTCYAMAETVFAVSQSAPGQPVRRLDLDRSCLSRLGPVVSPQDEAGKVTLLSNGSPIRGCQLGVLRDGDFVGEREIGEICVRAPFLFEGYFKNAQSTREVFVDGGWYRTGDLGFIDNNEVFIVGRLKEVIIVNGKNVFAHDVEAALSKISGLKPGRSVAFSRYVEALGSEQIVIVSEFDGVAERTTLISQINNSVIDEIGVPCGDIRIVEPGWLIKTTSGKISRSLNSEKYLNQFR